MNPRLGLALLSILPKHALSRTVGRLARTKLSRPFVSTFARRFQIDLDEASRPLADYPTLVDLFCRELKPGLRPIDPDPGSVTSPVDGRVAQFGRLDRGELVQAKGVTYTAAALLGSEEAARRYEGGYYITIYLSPQDYHRIHTPAAGQVVGATYVPGTLWPVNELGRKVPGLFAKNERLITFLATDFGQVAVVKVGATIVGSVKVVYDERLGTNVRRGRLQTLANLAGPKLAKGAELGRFEFGSTVILLIEPGPLQWASEVAVNAPLRLGQPLLRRISE